MKPDDLTGRRFKRLVAVSRSDNCRNGKARWNCVCDCGNKTIVFALNLKRNHTTSCGCHQNNVRGQSRLKHGKTNTRLFRIHQRIKTRCLNKNYYEHHLYGGRGIKICDEWMDFKVFYMWAIKNGYSNALTIDRIDNNKGYNQNNCRWATKTTQARNRRKRLDNTSGYIGVSKDKRGRYRAEISVNKKSIYLGMYDMSLDAAIARDKYILDNKLKNYTLNGII